MKKEVIKRLLELIEYKDREFENLKKEKVRDNYIPIVSNPFVPKDTIIFTTNADETKK